MNRQLSLYLDICRFLAAAMVFLSHVAARQISGGFLWPLADFGEDAVAVFFVLSGFVIAYVTETRETDARTYAVSRLARLYSVALPALLLTFALDAAGAALRPDLYSAAYISYGEDAPAWRALAGLLFINELWNSHTVIGSNGPYWSLGFEAWYYVAFGLFAFSPARWRIPLAALALGVMGPKIAVLFPLWLTGVALFHFLKRVRIPQPAGWVVFLGTPALFLAVHFLGLPVRAHMFAPFTATPAQAASTLYFTALGLVFAAHVAGFAAVAPAFAAVLDRHAARIRAIAGATFSLYLFHMPVMLLVVAAAPWPPSAWPTRMLVVAVPLAACFALSVITERRKDVWRGLFTRLVTRMFTGGHDLMRFTRRPSTG